VREKPGQAQIGVTWPDNGLVGLGIGLAATGVGTVLGLAAERFAVARRVRAEAGVQDDGRGGVPLGSVRGEPRVVLSGGVPLHVEVDEPDPAPATAPGPATEETGRTGRTRKTEKTGKKSVADGAVLTVILSHGYALTLD
jgi:hypothetical protein